MVKPYFKDKNIAASGADFNKKNKPAVKKNYWQTLWMPGQIKACTIRNCPS